MTTYRTGGCWKRTLVKVGTQPPDAQGRRPDDELVGMVDDPVLAERICTLLNADPACDCGHEGLDPMFHLHPCPLAKRRQSAEPLPEKVLIDPQPGYWVRIIAKVTELHPNQVDVGVELFSKTDQ